MSNFPSSHHAYTLLAMAADETQPWQINFGRFTPGPSKNSVPGALNNFRDRGFFVHLFPWALEQKRTHTFHVTNSGKGVWALHALLYRFYRSPGSCRSFGAVAVQAQQIASRHAFFVNDGSLLMLLSYCDATGSARKLVSFTRRFSLLLLLLLLIQPILTEHDCPVHHGLSRTITASGRQCAWIVQPSERSRACTCVCACCHGTCVGWFTSPCPGSPFDTRAIVQGFCRASAGVASLPGNWSPSGPNRASMNPEPCKMHMSLRPIYSWSINFHPGREGQMPYRD